MLQVIWNEDAEFDLAEILNYIAARNPSAADRMQSLFARVAEKLPEQPFAYRAGRVDGLREIVVHPNYILIFRVERDAIRIVNVLHARQQYP